jgi:hypothetical protein
MEGTRSERIVMTWVWIGLAFVGGLVAFPLILFLLRDVLPPTLFVPSDWDE